jgi:hypothetical protein
MLNIIPLEQLISIEINVSEKIDDKNLKDFVLTSLELNNKNYSNNDLIYATYIEELNQYQIFIVNYKYKIATFQIFELFYEEKTEGLDLYLADDFFCLYKNGFFYYYQTIEFVLETEEFLEFINKKFNTEINNYKRIEKDYLEELKNEYVSKNKKTTIKNINIKSNNSFKVYLIYLFLLTSSCVYFYTYHLHILKNENMNKTDTQGLDFKRFKKEYIFTGLENDFNKILQNIKINNLELSYFEYKQNSIKIVLSSEIKENLYLFLKEYKKSLISSSINFDENRKLYEVIAYVKLSK